MFFNSAPWTNVGEMESIVVDGVISMKWNENEMKYTWNVMEVRMAICKIKSRVFNGALHVHSYRISCVVFARVVSSSSCVRVVSSIHVYCIYL